jgi:hypothetical protein
VPDLFAALARKRLNREALLDKTRLVLAEKEKEVTKAWAEKATAVAEKATIEAELEATTLRLKTKNTDDLRLANSVNLRGAIGKCRVSHVFMEISLSYSPSTIIHTYL